MDTGEQGAAAVSIHHEDKVHKEAPARPGLLEGCRFEVDHNHLDNMLTFDLKDGRQWRKRIYPRVSYPSRLFRWGTVEEIVSFLISFDSHSGWIIPHVPQQPPSGTILFYDRSKTKKYRKDGYEWKTRKSLATIVREDRMRLKVGGYQLVYGCYAHSSSNPNLHRRTYWLIHNPNIIMVHYLEVTSSNCSLTKSKLEMELSDTPSDWSMLTISDCNMCALMDMVNTQISTDSLFSQLSLILNNNLEQATTLEEAIECNNAGLPVDMYHDIRSKKASTSYTKADRTITGQSPQLSSNSNPVDGKPEMESLYKAPHLVLCQSQSGTMSYFVTIPPPTDSVAASIFPPGTKLPLPSISQSVKGNRKKKGRKGKEKATDVPEKMDKVGGKKVLNIFSQMLSFVKPSAQPVPPAKAITPDISQEVTTMKGNNECETNAGVSTVTSSEPMSAVATCERNEMETCSSSQGVNQSPAYTNQQVSIPPRHFSERHPQAQAIAEGSYDPGEHPSNVSRDSETLLDMSLDLDADSVQQLLQLSQDTLSNTQTDVMNANSQPVEACLIESPPSPFTQLMNSLATPTVDSAHATPANTSSLQPTAESSSSHQGAVPLWMDVSNSNGYPSHNSQATASSSSIFQDRVPNFDFNPHTDSYHPQPQPQQNTCKPLSSVSNQQLFINQPQAPLNYTPQEIQEMCQHTNSGPYTNNFEISSTHNHDFSAPLYSISDTGCDPAVNSYLPFPGSMAPAEEYQDLESLMTTIINDTDAKDPHLAVPVNPNQPPSLSSSSNPTCEPRNASDSTSENTHPFTHSTSSSALSSISSDASLSHLPMQAYHLSLPDLTLSDPMSLSTSFTDAVPLTPSLSDQYQHSAQLNLSDGRSPSSRSSVSANALQDIPEGSQMELEEIPPMQQLDVCDYRTGSSPIPSSPGQGSVSSRSSVSIYDMFENRSPSVLELCEMLSESPNVEQFDFSHLTLSDSEQQQLYRAAKTIQSAFRKYKDRRQARNRQKRAAMMIEKYYKEYREAKEQQDHAARKIQQQYRDYRRSRDLNRAVLFVQQMYRYHRNKKDPNQPSSEEHN